MAGFIQNLLQDATGAFFGSDYLRDYTHASKTFRTNSYQYAPKLKFLFHVVFETNTEAYPNGGAGQNFGLAVKTIKLPEFSVDTQVMNQYNRKRIVQSKLKYEPINISFHDDNGNMVRNMWQAYYNYYYKDGRQSEVMFAGTKGSKQPTVLNPGGGQSSATLTNYNAKTTYAPDISGNADWGYVGESNTGSDVKVPFFKQITIFGLNQHQWSAYTLINPIITRFSHDTYSYADGGGTMENQMTIDYETVVYDSGALDGNKPDNILTGFGDKATYDRTVSPIARPGSNATILGQGGLLDGAGGVVQGLLQGDLNGLLKAAQSAGTTYNTFKNQNVSQLAKQEVVNGITNAIQQTPNRNINSVIPIFGATPQTSGTAGQTQGQASPVNIGSAPTAGTKK